MTGSSERKIYNLTRDNPQLCSAGTVAFPLLDDDNLDAGARWLSHVFIAFTDPRIFGCYPCGCKRCVWNELWRFALLQMRQEFPCVFVQC